MGKSRLATVVSALLVLSAHGCVADVDPEEATDRSMNAVAALEAEGPPVSTSSGDAIETKTSSAASAGAWVLYRSNAVDDYVELFVNVPSAGTYDISFGTMRNAYRGIARLSVDGANQGQAVDLYAASPTFTEVDLATVTFATGGSHKFRFTVTGKHAASGGHQIALDYLRLTPVVPEVPLLADDGFENGISSTLYNIRADGVGVLEKSSTHAREGGFSMREKVAKNGTTNYRQEVRHRDAVNETNMAGSPDYWLGISIYVPASASLKSQSVAFQWHNYYECCSPTIGLRIQDGKWRISREVGTNSGAQLSSVVTNQWHDWVFRVRWRTDATGLLQIWHNGTLVVDFAGIQTGLQHDSVQPYAKFGIYSSSWISAKNPDVNGTVHERWHDALRICNAVGCGYSDVAPRGDRLAAK